MTDARFEDGAERALSLRAEAPEDLPVVSALMQDAVLSAGDLRWDRKARKLALLVNRFRWENRAVAERAGRPYERVRSLLIIGDVTHVSSQGITPGDGDTVLSVMALSWEPGPDGSGRVVVTLAGDGAVAAGVECLDVTLKDVTRPYLAPTGRVPTHPQ